MSNTDADAACETSNEALSDASTVAAQRHLTIGLPDSQPLRLALTAVPFAARSVHLCRRFVDAETGAAGGKAGCTRCCCSSDDPRFVVGGALLRTRRCWSKGVCCVKEQVLEL